MEDGGVSGVGHLRFPGEGRRDSAPRLVHRTAGESLATSLPFMANDGPGFGSYL